MAALADDDVVVDRDADRRTRALDRLGHLDVRIRRRRVARGMVVDHDDRRGAEFERPLDDLARVDRGVIDGAFLLHLVGDQHVLAIEKQDAEALGRAVAHAGAAVGHHLVPRGQNRPLHDLVAQQPERRRLGRLE